MVFLHDFNICNVWLYYFGRIDVTIHVIPKNSSIDDTFCQICHREYNKGVNQKSVIYVLTAVFVNEVLQKRLKKYLSNCLNE